MQVNMKWEPEFMKWEPEFEEPSAEELADAGRNPKAYGLDEDGFPNAEQFNAIINGTGHPRRGTLRPPPDRP